ncbi:MAG: hypothetical protein KDC91_10155 [Flavobacteriaceae bacterium]|nr:hypothetical protein [Flavobacteriaceae bacterium]
MKIVQVFKYFLIILLISGCIPTRRISFNNDNVKSFKQWKEDSIKSFLVGNWVRIGRFDGKNIKEDTLGPFYYYDNNQIIATTRIINPKGFFHLVNDSINKQLKVPTIRFDFRGGSGDLIENYCTPPDFLTCEISISPFYIDRLIFINEKPVREIYANGKTKRILNPIHYLNRNLILIEDIAYIKGDKMEEYAANNGYNPAGENK